MAAETVFVAGATGLVGKPLIRRLVDRGHQVRALVRNDPSATGVLAMGAEPVLGDLATPGPWQDHLGDCTSVVDASQSRPGGRLTARRAVAAGRDRVRFTRNLFTAIQTGHAPLGSYVWLTGLDELVPSADRSVDETSPITIRPRGFGRIGSRIRPVVEAAHHSWGLPLVSLHMGLVYGSEGWFPEYLRRIQRQRFALVGDGENFTSLISVHDVARAIVAAVERRPAGRRFVVVDDEPVRQAEFVRFVAEGLGAPVPRRKVPLWLAGLVVGRAAAETAAADVRGRNARMKADLGVELEFPTYREGIPPILAEYLARSRPPSGATP
ncbi:MAG TPA: NAD-dependent epimerase/dehydratase family protein [Thermoplasmata archaeon]|nr:NAD-dependent epimerase/dehydratase family protein [Thermoplasmata archaeon]